jgi:hypothetical protein
VEEKRAKRRFHSVAELNGKRKESAESQECARRGEREDALDPVGVLDEDLAQTRHQRLGDTAQHRGTQRPQHIEREECRVPQLVDLDDLGDEAEEGGDDALVEEGGEGVGGREELGEEVKGAGPVRTRRQKFVSG